MITCFSGEYGILICRESLPAGYKAAQSANQIDQDASRQAKQKREMNLKFEQTNEVRDTLW